MIELTRVLPPPPAPALVPRGEEFDLLETQLGTRLPSDFRDFWKLYGAGVISDFAGVLRPQQRPPDLGYVSRVLELLREEERSFSATNWQAYPAVGGLIPWGGTNNGDFLCWRANGSPDAWRVAVLPPRSETVDDYDMSMTQFLSRWISGEIAVKSFPRDIVHGFEPRSA